MGWYVAIFFSILGARVVYVLAKNREPQRPQAPRTREGPQVVGFACARCGERIIFDGEAVPCETCGKPTHTRCLPHGHEEPAGPYRG